MTVFFFIPEPDENFKTGAQSSCWSMQQFSQMGWLIYVHYSYTLSCSNLEVSR